MPALPPLPLLATLLAGGAAEVLRPRYARVDGRIETLWQRPRGEPQGIYFFAHGCMHQGTDVFSDTGHDGWLFEECAESNFGSCLGLPEEVRLRASARARGYVVVAVSGGYGVQSCWDLRRDAAHVARALDHVRGEERLAEDLAVVAVGASSGGAFVGELARPVEAGGLRHLRCIVPQIMATGGVPNRGVPTLFVHMPRDARTAGRVDQDLAALRQAGVRAAELRVEPVPVTEALLARCLPAALAREVVAALAHENVLDAQGYLKNDARSRHWVASAQRVLQGRSNDSLRADESCLAELMNVAWAKHECVSQYVEQMFDFCEEKGDYARQRGEL